MATAGGQRGAGPERAWCGDLCAAPGAVIRLDPEESAHLVRSRRAQAGDPVVVFDGQGVSRAGVLTGADPRAAEVELGGDYPDRTPARRVRLAVALPEMGRTDRMLGHLAALGVAEVVPLLTTRGQPGRAEQAVRRAPRWAKLAREAAKVNGSARVLVVGASRPLAAFLEEPALLLDPDPEAPPLTGLLSGQDPLPWILIGPEGGFTDEEMTAARAAEAGVARLGDAALRVETAAIAAAAVALCS